jgi:phosphate transport system substrate-binding protein
MKNSGFSIKTGAFCILSIVGAAILPTNVMADNVTLKSADGTVNLTGEFLAFEDNSYMMRTPLGDLRIAASRVTCEGDACPVFEVESADVQIAGSDAVGLGLMPLLLEGYAGNIQAAATISARAGDRIVAELIGDDGFGDDLGSYLVTSTGSSDAYSTLLEK